MITCTFCNKAIYGHPEDKLYKPVCMSCTLTKTPPPVDEAGIPIESDENKGKDAYEVKLALAKAITSLPSKKRMGTMSFLRIKSNFARNQVIMLDGNHPLTFDAYGEAHCPLKFKEALERLITAKPGRFKIIGQPVALPTPEVTNVEQVIETQEVEVETEVTEEEPKQLLMETPPKRKAGRPKKNTYMEDI